MRCASLLDPVQGMSRRAPALKASIRSDAQDVQSLVYMLHCLCDARSEHAAAFCLLVATDCTRTLVPPQAKAAGLAKPSVLEAKRNPGRYAEQKFQQDALVGETIHRKGEMGLEKDTADLEITLHHKI